MVQHFAQFQQLCHPGSGGNNYFSGQVPAPRSEAACAICAMLEWKEHRYQLNLFGQPPTGWTEQEKDDRETSSSSEEEEERRCRSVRIVNGIAYIKKPEKIQELLNVERYAERWPLIPKEELHASSVQHPDNPAWRWLLHSRRVPVLPYTQAGSSTAGEDSRPPCAGIGMN